MRCPLDPGHENYAGHETAARWLLGKLVMITEEERMSDSEVGTAAFQCNVSD